MIRRIFWDAAAACALVALGTFGVRAVLSLDDLQRRVQVAEAQVRALAMPMTSPIRPDATVQECTTVYKCRKEKNYHLRSGK